jgi:bloom syndrome protein
MITQGVAEQTGASRDLSSHEQALKTHKDNLLRMVSKILYAGICLLLQSMETVKNMLYLTFLQVSYCENDVDCRRLLQLIHFGERFDPSLCAKTCDNCLKVSRWVEKDVTNIARQLVSGQMCPFQMHSHISLYVNLNSCFVASLG